MHPPSIGCNAGDPDTFKQFSVLYVSIIRLNGYFKDGPYIENLHKNKLKTLISQGEYFILLFYFISKLTRLFVSLL